MLGIVPERFSLDSLFEPLIKEANELMWLKGVGRPSKKELFAYNRIQSLNTLKAQLGAVLNNSEGWLIFFYTDDEHHTIALRFFNPATKEATVFKPTGMMGIFGIGLSCLSDRPLPHILFSDEFNQLQLQSVAASCPRLRGRN